MGSLVMIDAAADLRPIVPQVRAAGVPVDAAVVYLGAGGAGAFVATPQYVADLQGMGLAVLPCFNNAVVNAGVAGTAAQARTDMERCMEELAQLGVPAGCYAVLDIERSANAKLQGGYLATVASVFRSSIYAGAGIVYGALFDSAFGAAFDAALAADLADVGRLCFWLASYIGADAPVPQWTDPFGPTQLPWQAQHQDQVVAWQYRNAGAYDLSVLRLPLPSYGTEGLWLPGGGVGQPTATAAPNVPAARAAVGQAMSALGTASAALGG